MRVVELPLFGCFRIEPDLRRDARGQFARVFCAETFAAQGLASVFLQANASMTARRGTVRGMHAQRGPAKEAKLIRCVRGRVFDAIVDLRAGSSTFGRWTALELGPDDWTMAYVAPGCAHGFQALTDDVELVYLHSAPYAPDHETGLHPSDPQVGIAWPLAIVELSARDAALPLLDALEPIA